MSSRVKAVATAIGTILRAPEGRKELAGLYSVLGYCQAKTLTKLLATPKPCPDRMLTVDEAAEICGRKRSFLYERAVDLGFGHRANGCRGLRISERELRRWMEG